jgi:hypothetical protein
VQSSVPMYHDCSVGTDNISILLRVYAVMCVEDMVCENDYLCVLFVEDGIIDICRDASFGKM